MVAELVVFAGLQASGKSTFFRGRFAAIHEHVSEDIFPNNRNRAGRQRALVGAALGAGRPVVVDNTNPTVADRREPVGLGRAFGAGVAGYHFDSTVGRCLARNARRGGRARVPDVAVFATAKRFVAPSYAEGFDGLWRVRLGEAGFEVARVRRDEWDPARRGTQGRQGDREEAPVASSGRELLGERYGKNHLTYEEIQALGLAVVTEEGEDVPPEDLRGKVFRIVDPDEPSGYVVRSMETTGEATTLCYLRRPA